MVRSVVISSLINGRTGFPSSNSLVRNLPIQVDKRDGVIVFAGFLFKLFQ